MALLSSIGITNITKDDTIIIDAVPKNSILTSIYLTNLHYGNVPVSVWVERNNERLYLSSNTSISANESKELLNGSKISILINDKIKAKAAVANTINGLLTLYEDT
jgi:hypothetical protein